MNTRRAIALYSSVKQESIVEPHPLYINICQQPPDFIGYVASKISGFCKSVCIDYKINNGCPQALMS